MSEDWILDPTFYSVLVRERETFKKDLQQQEPSKVQMSSDYFIQKDF